MINKDKEILVNKLTFKAGKLSKLHLEATEITCPSLLRKIRACS